MFVKFEAPNLKELKTQGYTCVDLHIHTSNSKDAFTNVDDILKKAKQYGFGIGITEHNDIKGAVYAYKNNNGVQVIPGIEVKPQSGIDIIFYFYAIEDLKTFYNNDIAPFQKNNPFVNDQKAEDIINKAQKYRCLVSAPHPYTFRDLGLGQAIDKKFISDAIMERVDLVEGINGATVIKNDERAFTMAKNFNKKMVGGSDAHSLEAVGSVLTCVKLAPSENFLDKIRHEQALVVGQPRNIVGVAFEFIKGHFRMFGFEKGWTMVKGHLKVCLLKNIRTRKKYESKQQRT